MEHAGHLKETALAQDGAEHPASVVVPKVLGLLGDKWTILVIRCLGQGPRRFNAIRREIPEVSQKMLTSTLRNLERNGLVLRVVTPTSPPQVEYSLTPLGESLTSSMCVIAHWAEQHGEEMEAAQARHDARHLKD